MVPPPDSTVVPVSPGELLTRYLDGQAEAINAGMNLGDPSGEVVPHDAGAVQPVDPRVAWDEALAALATGNGRDLQALPIFPEWRTLVAAQEPALDLAFCVGNFPQMVRNLNRLLQELTFG